MGSPEATLASVEGVQTPEGVFEELTGSLQGWKRKISGKKAGTPKKKDVSFLAPDGEEIKNKQQLNKYLKAHPGTVTASDFEWGIAAGEALTPGETRRRSARLNSKGRSSTDGLDVEAEPKQPVAKRSRKSRDNGKVAEKPEEKTGNVEGLDIPADQPLDKKEEENGEEKEISPNEESKAMDVDVPKVEAPAVEGTKDITAETQSSKLEDQKEPAPVTDNVEEPLKAPAVGGAELDLVSGLEAENNVKHQDTGTVYGGKANGEEVVTPVLKTKEVEPPQPKGINALVDGTHIFGEAPKPLEEEASQAPEAVVEPLGLSI